MKIFTHKTDAMRQILNMVSRGYSRYTTGEVQITKAEALYLKFSDRYGIAMTAQQKWRAKERGEANAHFVAWIEDETIHWWLLATNGQGVINDLEKLQDASDKKTRIEITGYELVKTPREGAKAQWSWRMTTQTYQDWESRLKAAVRHFSDDGMRQAIYSLKRVPAFAESRRQAFTLAKLAKEDWKRIKRDEWPYGEVYLGWFGQYKKADALPLASLRRKVRSEQKQ